MEGGAVDMQRDWTVLLIGGASGTGKSSVSYALGKRYGVGVLEVDDFQVMMEVMTTPATHPAIHYWETHPDWKREGVDATVGQLVDVGREMLPGLSAVVKNHVDTGMPVIMEGDFILPELAAVCASPAVRAVFVHEPDVEQIVRNYLAREPEAGEQRYRAQVSAAYSGWLAARCAELGVPMVMSRPWDDVVERAEVSW